jgi:hypothetical protein
VSAKLVVDRALELPKMEDDGHEVRAEARKDERAGGRSTTATNERPKQKIAEVVH